jgi:hypothetical protein
MLSELSFRRKKRNWPMASSPAGKIPLIASEEELPDLFITCLLHPSLARNRMKRLTTFAQLEGELMIKFLQNLHVCEM